MKKLLLIVFLSFNYFCSFSQTAKELIDTGDDFISNKKYDSALLALNKAWKLDSTIYAIYIARGLAFSGLKNWEESYLEYTKGINKYPDSAYGYHLRALLFSTTGYIEEAIADNTKALELVDEDSMRLSLFINRGVAYMQKRDYQKAYEDYSRAFLLDTNHIATINNIATVLDELGRVEEAIGYLKKIILLDSTFIGSYVNLGFQFTKLGRYQEAIEFFGKALTIEKDEPLTLNNRGLARYHLKDYIGALDDINKSLNTYPSNSYAYKNRALVYLAMKEKDKACADIKTAIDKGFTEMYGNEILDLQKANCPGK